MRFSVYCMEEAVSDITPLVTVIVADVTPHPEGPAQVIEPLLPFKPLVEVVTAAVWL